MKFKNTNTKSTVFHNSNYGPTFGEQDNCVQLALNMRNDTSIKSWISGYKTIIKIGVQPAIFRSAVDFGNILINPTNEEVLNLLQQYAIARQIKTFKDNKIPISLRSLIRYIYHQVFLPKDFLQSSHQDFQ